MCAFTLCSHNRATDRLDRLLKIDSPGKFPRKPKRHPGCRDPYDRQFDPRDFLQNGRLNFCVWMFRIGKFARRLPLQHRVHSQHRHSRSLQSLVKWLDSPIEFVIANDPRVVSEMIKQIDHQLTFAMQADLGALIDVADVDQNRVWILSPPAPDLRDATRHATAIGISIVIGGGQNVSVQIRRMQDGDADRIRLERSSRTCQRRERADQSGLASEFQEIAPRPESIKMQHRFTSVPGASYRCAAY